MEFQAQNFHVGAGSPYFVQGEQLTMADMYTQGVIWPPVPNDLLDDLTKDRLAACGIEWEDAGHDRLYLFASDGPYNGMIYLNNDQEPTEVDYVELLQQLIIRSAGRLKALTIEAADTCSKMRPDGFGGWAMIITAMGCTDDTQYLSTYEWIRTKVKELGLDQDVYGTEKDGGSHVDHLG
jgi:hypothetical protein